MTIDGSTITFSTGKEVYGNAGIVGLCLTETGLTSRLHYGYDGDIGTVDDPGFDPEYSDQALTRDEQKELADHMIAAWTAFREAL
jgi:hypothetical protein